MMDGTILVTSKEGKGTVFVTLLYSERIDLCLNEGDEVVDCDLIIF